MEQNFPSECSGQKVAPNTSSPQRILLVGCGKMGEAILSGWLAANEGAPASLSPQSFVVVNPGADRCAYLCETYGVTCYESLDQLEAEVGTAAAAAAEAEAGTLEPFDMVLLAVKPQVMGEVLQQLSPCSVLNYPNLDNSATNNSAPNNSQPIYVSIAAGIPTKTYEAALGASAPVVRVMPNMALEVSAGASGLCAGSAASAQQLQVVCDLFAALGTAKIVQEAQMDALCALSGSGPAYVALLVESMAKAGTALGLEEDTAYDLALQTVLGTASLIAQTGRPAEEVRKSICSPGGTTLAALEVFESRDFGTTVEDAMTAAVNRGKELAKCS